jgi:NADPH2 dehydrogenase
VGEFQQLTTHSPHSTPEEITSSHESQPSAGRRDQLQVAGTGFAVLFCTVGIALWGLPYDFMVQQFGWTRAQVTSGNAVSKLVVGPLIGFVAGWMVDRFGPRRIMMVGILLAGAALIGLGGISSLGMFYFFYIFNALGYVLGGPLPIQVLLTRWFDKSRGKAMGFAYLGIGVGGALAPWISHALVQHFGWQTALRLLGVLVILIAFPPAFVLKQTSPASNLPVATSPPVKSAFHSLPFYLLVLGSMASIGAVTGTQYNLKLFLSLDRHYSQTEATRVLSLVLAFSIAGRLLMGWLADRFSKKYVNLSSDRGRDSRSFLRTNRIFSLCLRRRVRNRIGWRLYDHSPHDGGNLRRTGPGSAHGNTSGCRRHCGSSVAMVDWSPARYQRQLFRKLRRPGGDGLAGRSCCFGAARAPEGGMSANPFPRLGSVKDVAHFQEHLNSLSLSIPCDSEVLSGSESPLLRPLTNGAINIGNRIAVQPMEGWDGTPDGQPSERTLRRWKHFGRSGAKLIWGGEAVAVSHEGRANPSQLVIAPHTEKGLAQLRATLIDEHRRTTGSESGLLIGLQLTHSGRFCRPNTYKRSEPRIVYHHPILDHRLNLTQSFALLSDAEIGAIIEDFHRAAKVAWSLGFDFVDIKHCHGYLAHELLSAHTRDGRFGGSFENRTRFLKDVVQGVRSVAPRLQIGVRLSAFDTIPFRPDANATVNGKTARGVPEAFEDLIPYRWGFGVNPQNPTQPDLTEAIAFLSLLEELGIQLVNLTAGSPYYNPHIQRPASYPPSDGYQPPEDPLLGVARQMEATWQLKQQFPNLLIVGSAYSYLQEFLPNVAQAAIREGWVDLVGMGRMVLTYPELLWDACHGQAIQRKRICRTFSDCTTAPRNGLPSGCYPLDSYYKNSEFAEQLKAAKKI